MSGGVLIQAALRELARAGFPSPAHVPLAAVLEHGLIHAGLPDFLYAAGRDVGLDPADIVERSVPIMLLCCAGHLTDDIVDGEDTYGGDRRLNPAWECLLLNLAYARLAASSIDRQHVVPAATALARATAHLGLELATTRWTAPRYREIGNGIAGLQFAAIVGLLWGDRRADATEIGHAVGIVIHVAEDIRSGDHRFASLDAPDKRTVLTWAYDHAANLAALGMSSLDAVVAQCRPQYELVRRILDTPIAPKPRHDRP